MNHKQGLVLDPDFLRIRDSCLLLILGNVRPIHGVSYPQILFIYLINYFNKLNFNIRHFILTPISNPLFNTATWRSLCLFTSLILFIHVSVIYQKKVFWVLYNFVLTYIYKKMQSKGRKSIKTLNLCRPAWILGCHRVSPHFCEGHGG